MARTKQSVVGVPAARLAFLYGIGTNGEPCRDRARLKSIAGVSDKTLLLHLEKWTKELEEMAVNSGESILGVTVKPETSESHQKDVAFLRHELDRIQDEISMVDDIQSEIWDLVSSLRDLNVATSEQIDSMIALVDRYLKKSMNRQNLLSLFLSVHRRWQDSSGMTGVLDATITGMKEVEKARRLAELRAQKAPASSEVPSGPAHLRDASVFRR